ncbi:gliding motility protein GldN [Flammeovirga yaeyamensis]|uniref:Gliding motility protein GldN n=1 Tax=Flammeovirga yaeyamensis TaxID=367791 RepID=A0AAX1N3T1_9BACT|nr:MULTISPECIES: gliding motility protein GldN [Flammeovirga]ANQ50477.2 gliding motility protein GldN [Flammeovirga sp. MY04]MBB3700681.1 gliding motility associated protein GldN [Flammeovirga yaeyamensis]NMF37793.1 gliding motility protein GldN [Flammeovirga yaeyamensis]QWG02100.1 gliding motility protein GldN [Flammeovirga yaeyamensis]
MKNINRFRILFISLILSSALSAQAQLADTLSNPHSMMDIQNYEMMWKKSLWYRVNLGTKINNGFFARNHEVTRVIIDAVKNDRIVPYSSDSLENRISKEEFLQRLIIPQTVNSDDEYEDDDAAWGDVNGITINKDNGQKPGDEYDPTRLWVVELKVDRIFDKRRSKMYNDLVAVNLIIPAQENPKGIDIVLGSFSFRELNDNVFHTKAEDGSLVKDPDAIWYNGVNPAQHRNLGEAFALELWDGRLIKFENPQDNSIIMMYGNDMKSLYQSQEAVYKLMEYEALLWEY